MGIAACIETLRQVVTATDPVRMQSARFRPLSAPRSGPARAMPSPRAFTLDVVGSAATNTTGLRRRRKHLVDLSVTYPVAGFGEPGELSEVIAEDVAQLAVALAASNTGLMAGVGIVYDPQAHEVGELTPEGAAAPVGLVLTLPFEIETQEG